MSALVRRHGWSIALALLLSVLLVATRLIQPTFGAAGLESLARAALPFAFATAAMAVVVIAGGIDLSVASMMAVSAVTAAVLTPLIGGGAAVAVALAAGVAMGAVNGVLVVLTRVPDIVVTLAMLFVWEGVALLILPTPGGAAPAWLPALISGAILGVPVALIVLAVVVAAVWVPIARSTLGLSLYAVGSDPLAAFRSGVPVARTRIISYALAGLLSAFGGLSLLALTGIGEPVPGPYLLAAVAAVVLGGVVLGGGKGGILGPLVAVFVLRIIRTILTLMAVDPNVTTIVEGVIMVAVVMLGGLVMLRGARR